MRTAVERVESAAATDLERPGDRRFDRLWNLHRERTRRLIARLAGNLDEADDLTQEVSLQALRSFPGFRSESKFFTWLYRIAVNVVLRWREKRVDTLDSFECQTARSTAALTQSPESHVLKDALRITVWNALDTLPADQRTALILRVYEGLSYREIAEVMETPVGTVMSRLHAGRQKMREELKDYEM